MQKKDKDYFFKLLPYAFVFDNTKHLASIFEYVKIESPSWYLPYGMKAGYDFDVLVMNSMTTALYKELKTRF